MSGKARRCWMCVAVVLIAAAVTAPAGAASPFVTGRVVDAQGKPVAGAHVWSGWTDWDESRTRYVATFLESSAVLTDAEGRFQVRRAPSVWTLLDVCRAGYVSWREAVPSNPSGPVEIRLATAARVSGRVVSPSGAPVPGARVEANSHALPPGSNIHGGRCGPVGNTAEAIADAEGRFTLEPLLADWYVVRAEAPGWRRTPPLRLPGEVPSMASVTCPEIGHFTPPQGNTIRFAGLTPGDWKAEATLKRRGVSPPWSPSSRAPKRRST